MKQLTNYQRAAQYLKKVFKLVNEEYFNSQLEVPTITIQSTAAAYGHVSVNKVWYNAEEASRELNISADYLNRPIENIVATLIHEGCHLWAMQNGIKDTSNRGIYHNARFRELAEERGLVISRHELYGWTVTEPGERTLDFCIANGLQDIQLFRQTAASFPTGIPKAGDGAGIIRPVPKKPSCSRKYVCPCCGNIARTTKEMNLICGDCEVQMIWEA
ncbi:MAG: SprT-like domain-containing protein [Eubacteriales bacterium]|nr:SprT-like domain-containing protein [Eubacteriales bacterium]